MSFDPRSHYQNSNVAQSYDQERFSSVAGRFFQNAELKTLERLLAPLPKGASLLDVPVGTGRVSQALINWGYVVTAADISHEMIEVARNRVAHGGASLPATRGSADALPFADGSFDAVLSMRFLPHISCDSRRLMLKEMARVSRRWVMFSNSYSSGWYQTRRRVKRYLGHQAPTRYPVTEADVQGDLRFAGLKEVSRYWTCRFISEEILVLCEKANRS